MASMAPAGELHTLHLAIERIARRLRVRRRKGLAPLQKHLDELHDISAKLKVLDKHPKRKFTAVSGESEFGPFLASKRRNHFHRPECKWLKDVKPDKLNEFSTHKEAVEAGCKPCKTCRS